jgi:hypothetical protein
MTFGFLETSRQRILAANLLRTELNKDLTLEWVPALTIRFSDE